MDEVVPCTRLMDVACAFRQAPIHRQGPQDQGRARVPDPRAKAHRIALTQPRPGHPLCILRMGRPRPAKQHQPPGAWAHSSCRLSWSAGLILPQQPIAAPHCSLLPQYITKWSCAGPDCGPASYRDWQHRTLRSFCHVRAAERGHGQSHGSCWC